MFPFRKLAVWNESIELFQVINEILKRKELKNERVLDDQLKRATLSVSNNIAESTGRIKTQEKKHFLSIARGSIYEVANLVYIFWNNHLISKETFNELYKKCDKISGMLFCMIKSDKYKGI